MCSSLSLVFATTKEVYVDLHGYWNAEYWRGRGLNEMLNIRGEMLNWYWRGRGLKWTTILCQIHGDELLWHQQSCDLFIARDLHDWLRQHSCRDPENLPTETFFLGSSFFLPLFSCAYASKCAACVDNTSKGERVWLESLTSFLSSFILFYYPPIL